jgi:hypothetical protein
VVGPIRNSDQKPLTHKGSGKEGPTSDGKTLEAPDNTVPSEAAARTIYTRLKHQHMQRCHTYERIQGMLNGNPPYNPHAMAAAGLTDMANVNWKDGDAIYRSIALAYWSLFNEVKSVIDIKVSLSDDEGQNTEWSSIMSEEWDKIIRSWPNFIKHMSVHQGQMLRFGLSLIIWPDERDWRFKPINAKSFMLPDQTRNDLDDLTLIAIENKYSAQYLWEIYDNLQDSKGHWNRDALGEILFQLANIPDDESRDTLDCK